MLFSPLHTIWYLLWGEKGQENEGIANMGRINTITPYTNGNKDLQGILLDELNAYMMQMIDMFCVPLANDKDKLRNV